MSGMGKQQARGSWDCVKARWDVIIWFRHCWLPHQSVTTSRILVIYREIPAASVLSHLSIMRSVWGRGKNWWWFCFSRIPLWRIKWDGKTMILANRNWRSEEGEIGKVREGQELTPQAYMKSVRRTESKRVWQSGLCKELGKMQSLKQLVNNFNWINLNANLIGVTI